MNEMEVDGVYSAKDRQKYDSGSSTIEQAGMTLKNIKL